MSAILWRQEIREQEWRRERKMGENYNPGSEENWSKTGVKCREAITLLNKSINQKGNFPG